MSEQVGREMTLAIGTDGSEATITGVRTKSFTINNEPVDITNDDDDGWRDMLSVPGQKSVDYSCEGVVVDDDVRALAAAAADVSTNVVLTFPTLSGETTPANLECQAVITSYAETGQYNEAITFTLELQSKGAVTYTAGS
jgi:predicted secreted protein